MPKLTGRWILIVCVLTALAFFAVFVEDAVFAENAENAEDATAPKDKSVTTPKDKEDTAASLRRRLAQQAAPATLDDTWYRPHEERKGKTNPLAVILASKDFPVSAEDFWVPTLWKENFCTLVLVTENKKSWTRIRMTSVMKEIEEIPNEVSADPNRMLLIADAKTGPLALRILDTFPNRVVGIVFITFTPVQITPTGPGLWQPSKDAWSVPMWAVVGTRGKSAAKVLELWRKLSVRAPAKASLTVDPRLGRGLGHLLPDQAILPWLRSLQAGRRPEHGPDRQAEAERKKFAPLAKKIRKEFQRDAPPLPAGKTETKTDGPFQITTQVPEGWIRDREGEKAYTPSGPKIDASGRTISEFRNPYAGMYLTPKRRGLFFVRVRAARGTGNGETLLEQFEKLVIAKGYLPVNIERWKKGAWTFDVSSYLLAWENTWRRWIALTATNDSTPAAPIIMVMDATEAADPAKMAATMKRMIESTKVGWNETDKTHPKKLD